MLQPHHGGPSLVIRLSEEYYRVGCRVPRSGTGQLSKYASSESFNESPD